MKSKDRSASPFMGSVKLGPKGQIVIPKEVRDMFGIEPGDTLVILAHPKRGIALERPTVLTKLADAIFDGHASQLLPPEDVDGSQDFASEVRRVIGEAEK